MPEIEASCVGTQCAVEDVMSLYGLSRTVALCLLVGCAFGAERNPDDEFGMNGPVSPTPPPGKADSEYLILGDPPLREGSIG